MQATTWIERISDETNPWLAANRKEEEGDPLHAFTLYLEDAGECLRQKAYVKAALSCSCAADCLAKMGRFPDAKSLIAETAHIYLENADSVIGKSVREALWSLREAHEYFQLAEDPRAAREVYERLFHLASRVDPNIGIDEFTQTPPSRASMFGGKSANEGFGLDNSSLVTEPLEQFMRLRQSRYDLDSKLASSPPVVSARRRGPINEESIISQLG